MKSNVNLGGCVVIAEVSQGDSSAFHNLFVNSVNLVAELSSLSNAENLWFLNSSVDSQGSSNCKTGGLSASVSGLGDDVVEGFLRNEWNRDSLDVRRSFEAQLIDDIAEDVLWDVEVLFFFPIFGFAEEWRCLLYNVLVFEGNDLFVVVLGDFLQFFVFLDDLGGFHLIDLNN